MFLLLGAFMLSTLTSCTRINAGSEGVKVSLAGGDKGTAQVQSVYGWTGYLPWATQVIEVSVRNQHYSAENEIMVQAKGGTNVIVHPSFNYRILPGQVANLYLNWGVTDDQQIQGKLLEASLLTNMREVTNGWTIDSLLNYRGLYDQTLEHAMNEKLKPYAQLFQFTSGVQPDKSMAAAIADKSASIQRAQAAENKRREVQALADLEIIQARKDSSVKVINASGEAESIRKTTRELSPAYIDYIRASNWNGVLPSTMLGSTSGTLFNLK